MSLVPLGTHWHPSRECSVVIGASSSWSYSSLDALTRERMATELMRIWEARQVTVVLVTHSIPEAVMLADRVLVLSARPGRVVLDLPIHMPRPRELSVAHTAEFGDLARQVRQAIR